MIDLIKNFDLIYKTLQVDKKIMETVLKKVK